MKAAVIGAGAGGLAAAYDLARAGHQVTLFEAADHVGGLAAGFKLQRWDWSVEQYYHHWFASDRHILGLIDELGLSQQVMFPWPTTAAYHQGRFYAMDGPLSRLLGGWSFADRLPGAGTLARGLYALSFPGLSLADKLRYGLSALYLLLAPSWKPFERVTAHEWLTRWMGKRGYETFWEPLLVGKFGPHYRQVNMAWFWGRVKARTPRLGTFEGGFQSFMDLLAMRVQELGAALELNTAVRSIEGRPEGGVRLRLADEDRDFDQCLTTTSPSLLAKMAPGLPDSYLSGLLNLKSMGAVVLVLDLQQQLSTSGFYWHNLPKAAGFPFLALVEHTNYVPASHFDGDHIVYCGDYLDPAHEYFSLSESELLDRFLPALQRINPAFSREWVRQSWLFRTPYAQPVPPVNHSQSIPPLKTPMAGLWFASMSQVYPWDRGTNYAVEIARRAVQGMLAEAAASVPSSSKAS
jgi:protoporphyrinogen oxidase